MQRMARVLAFWLVGVIAIFGLCWVAAILNFTARSTTNTNYRVLGVEDEWDISEARSWFLTKVSSGSWRTSEHGRMSLLTPEVKAQPTESWSRPARVSVDEFFHKRSSLFPRSSPFIDPAEIGSPDFSQWMTEDAWGWPLRAWASGVTGDQTPSLFAPDHLTVELKLSGGRTRYLPLRPLWWGVLIDGALTGLVIWSVFRMILWSRHRLRRIRCERINACPSCGYDRNGIGSHPCPECGESPFRAFA